MLADCEIPALSVPGDHNRANARLAATAARAAGCDDRAMAQGLKSFTGLAGRMEMVAVIGGRRFFNDTTATTPESTIAALRSVPTAVWLLAGGKDKGASFGALADAVLRYAGGAALYGATGTRLFNEIHARQPGFAATATQSMEQALRWCWHASRPGDSIVLSPACSSQDQFRNYVHRGREYMRLVRLLAERRNP
jgi:UDP-N-acetylmuramoylalanine--D-glutamate ligase